MMFLLPSKMTAPALDACRKEKGAMAATAYGVRSVTGQKAHGKRFHNFVDTGLPALG
jgi:hypothetical protein